MKKILIGFFVLSCSQLSAQQDTLFESNIRKVGDILFENLDQVLYGPSLLNRSFSSNEITLQQINGNYDQIHSVVEFFHLFQDLGYAYTDSTYLLKNQAFGDSIIDIYQENEFNSLDDELILPFGFLLHSTSLIDSTKFVQSNFIANDFHLTPLINESELYSKVLLKSGAVIEICPESGYQSAKLQYAPSLVSLSPDISNLNLRINAGQGFQDFNSSNPFMFFERTADSIVGILAFNYEKGNQIFFDTLKFYLTTKGESSEKSGESWDYDDIYVGGTIKYHYGVKTGCGNDNGKFRRPIIIMQPYRPGIQPFSMGKYYDQFNYKSVISSLSDMGYDVIFIKQLPGNASLEEAGLTLISFINYVNGKKENDYPNESWENTIMGYSMGGQIVRYALQKMEKDHMDLGSPHHHTKLYIPFDSPHHGVNIPISTQLVYGYFQESNLFAYLAYKSLIDDASLDMGYHHILAYTSQQLNNTDYLITPHPHSEHTNFTNAVNNDFLHSYSHPLDERRAFPSFTRNIAVSNGNLNTDYATEYSLNPGKLLFQQNAYVLSVNGTKYKKRKLYASEYGSNKPVFYDKEYHLILGFIPIVTSNILFSSHNALEWDMASGGYKDEFYDKEGLGVIPVGSVSILRTSANYWGQKYYHGHMSFLPTVSALAIKKSVWQNNDLFYNLKDEGLMYESSTDFDNNQKSDLYGYPNLAHPTQHFNITPFEAIYCDPQTYEHIKMQGSIYTDGLNDVYLVYLRDFILDEIEADVVCLQNKTIGKNHNPNLSNYKYKAWYKAYERIEMGNEITPKTDLGDFIIEATGDITVYAGQTISIKPGFHTQYGSDFHAYIDYSCSRPRSFQINENDLSSSYGSSEEQMKITNPAHQQKVEIPLIYPNPTEGSFVVQIPESQLGGNYRISNLNGHQIDQGIFFETNQKSFTFSSGVYIFSWTFEDKTSIHKIVIL